MKNFLIGIFFIILYTSSYAQVTKVIVGGFANDSLHNQDVKLSFLEGYKSYDNEEFPGIVDVGMGSVLQTYDYADANGYQMLIVSYPFPPSYWASQAPYYPDVMGCFPAGSNQHILRFDDSIATLPPNIIITGAGDTINMTAYKLNFFDIDPLSSNNSSSFSNGYIAGKLAYIMNHSQAVNPSWADINNVCTQTSSRNGMWDLEDGYGIVDIAHALAGALPVELVSFSAVIKDKLVVLNWRTETEVNNYGFEIQSSLLDDKWDVLGFVNGNGNSNSPKEYNFIDREVNSEGTYSYRLKQIDNDGTYEFSKTIEVNIASQGSFELSQNYPNPFNPTTTISFSLPNSGLTTLKVFNLLGEEVGTLANGYWESGTHTFNFNATNLPSGTYIYKLSTSEKSQSMKMLLMK